VPAIPPPLLPKASAEEGWRRAPADSTIAMHNLTKLLLLATVWASEQVGKSLCAKKFVEKFVKAGLSFDRGLPDTSRMNRRAASLRGSCPGWARAALRQKVAA